VLFDWLSRSSAEGQPAEFIDQAEERVLWDLESRLEALLPEILQTEYAERVRVARDRLRDDDE
jgi:hypothetical protein